MRTAPAGRITVEALGRVDHGTLAAVARALRAAYPLPTAVAERRRRLGDHGYRPRRGQYDANVQLDRLYERAPNGLGCVVALTEAGIYVPGFNFLYGLSYVGGHAALVSLDALRADGAGIALVRERAAKIAVHEAGHAFGLEHCREPRCVMRYSDRLERLDHERARFRPLCRRRLRELFAD